jgi:hypothetical protein
VTDPRNPLAAPDLEEALRWHDVGKQISPRAASWRHVEVLVLETLRLRQLLAARDVHPYLVQIYGCGDLALLPNAWQPLLFEKRVEGFVATTAEWETRIVGAPPTPLAVQAAPAFYHAPLLLAISEQEHERDDTVMLSLWNDDRSGPCGVMYVRVPPLTVPEFGLRLHWERLD